MLMNVWHHILCYIVLYVCMCINQHMAQVTKIQIANKYPYGDVSVVGQIVRYTRMLYFSLTVDDS